MSWTTRVRVCALQSLTFASREVLAQVSSIPEALTTNAWGLTILGLDRHQRSRSVQPIEARLVWRICCRSLVPELPLLRSSGRHYLPLFLLAWPPHRMFLTPVKVEFQGEDVAIEVWCQ
jgi:hypothetical protein